MKRKRMDALLDWKNSNVSKPALLTGARGVGKSYIAIDFAKSFYSNYIYINLEHEPKKKAIFFDSNVEIISSKLKALNPLAQSMEPILLILDEISDSNNAFKNILALAKNGCFHIIMISSIIEKNFIDSNEMEHINLFPLDFEEFLDATGKGWYIEVIKTHFNSDKKVPDIVHKELLYLFEEYLQIGGMPLAVNEFINTESKYNIMEQHKLLLNSYLADINGEIYDTLKISQVLATVDRQLMKENHKFQFTLIRKGATQGMYADALDYIQSSFYGIQCNKIGDDLLSLPEDQITEDLPYLPHFKLYLQDTGMLNTILLRYLNYTLDQGEDIVTDIEQRKQETITNEKISNEKISNEKISKNKDSEKMKIALAENYVAQCLTAKGYPLYFWESASQAKIDFLIVKNNMFLPIEVRASEHTRSKNISVFRTKCDRMCDSIKISTKNFEYTNSTKYVPIYAAFCI